MPSPSEPSPGAKTLAKAWPGWRRRVRDARSLVLFLDFDGTLVHIAARPGAISLAAEVIDVLRRLVSRKGVRLVVISGRPLEDLSSRLDIPGLNLLGSHGYEMTLPVAIAPLLARAREVFEGGARDLTRRLEPFAEAWLEHKPSGGTVHFRQVASERHDDVVRAVDEWYRDEAVRVQHLELRPARSAIEIRPRVNWGKGEAALWWIDAIGPREVRESLVLAAGDDDTDEDLFRACQESGFSVRVGGKPEETAALAWVDSPEKVWQWLEDVDSLRRPRKAAGK